MSDCQEVATIGKYIEGKQRFPKEFGLPVAIQFTRKGYKVLPAYSDSKKEYQAAQEFLNQDNEFKINVEDLADMDLVYLQNEHTGIQLCANTILFKCQQILFAFVAQIKISKASRKKGLGSQFFADLRCCMKQQQEQLKIERAFIVVGQSKKLKPHQFFKNLGFNESLPAMVKGWKQAGADMAALELPPFLAATSSLPRPSSLVGQLYSDNPAEIEHKLANNAAQNAVASLLSGGGSIAHGQRGGQYGGEDDNNDEEDEEIKEVAATKSALAGKSRKHAGTSPNGGGGDDRRSVISVASSMNVTTKTKSGNLHKHCQIGTCDGKRITGTAWVRHLKDKHQIASKDAKLKEYESYKRCIGDNCNYCTQGVQVKSNGKSVYLCRSCMKEKRTDSFPKDSKDTCKTCSKSPLKNKRETKRIEKEVLRETGLEFSLQGSDAQSQYMPQVQRGSQFVGQKRPTQETCRNLLSELDFIEEQASVFDEQIDANTRRNPLLPSSKRQKKQQQQQQEPTCDKKGVTAAAVEEDDEEFKHNLFGQKDDENYDMQFDPDNQQQTSEIPASTELINLSSFQITDNTLKQQTATKEGAVAAQKNNKKLVFHLDQQTIDKLKEIEHSNKSLGICALLVQDLCHMFTQDLLVRYFSANKSQKLVECVIELLQRSDQLRYDQLVGLLIAAITLGGPSWDNAVSMLQLLDNQRRASLLQLFKLHLEKYYNEQIAEWCVTYWEQVQEQQLQLMKYLRQNPSLVDSDIMLFSLIVVIEDLKEYATVTSSFARNAVFASCMVLDTIEKYPKQARMPFTQFIELASLLQSKAYASIINSIHEQLTSSQLCRWLTIVEQAKVSAAIANSESIQASLDELIAKYGEVKLNKDLTKTDDCRYSMFFKVANQLPNSKQFAVAQYCTAALQAHPRQLWKVPAGQGKGRIEHTAAFIALTLKLVSKVHFVYCNKELLERDRQDFATYLQLLDDYAVQVEYHVGYANLEPREDELVIIDEADALIYVDPEAFRAFIAKCACLCFTATPDDRGRGIDKDVLGALTFQQFNYIILDEPAAVVQQNQELTFDLTMASAMSDAEKASKIKECSTSGPVLVYCEENLRAELAKLDLPLLFVKEGVDHTALRCLDQVVSDGQYRVAVATDEFAMRGLDYRSKSVVLTLFLCKAFGNYRDAVQGYHRVGRFADTCRRINFADVPLIDAIEEAKYKLAGFKFVASMAKTQVQVKPIKVKEVQAPTAKAAKTGSTYTSRRLGQSRTAALLSNKAVTADPRQQALSFAEPAIRCKK